VVSYAWLIYDDLALRFLSDITCPSPVVQLTYYCYYNLTQLL